MDDELTARCTMCKRWLPAKEFYKNKNHRLGLSANCMVCHRAWLRKKRADNPMTKEEIWTEHLWRKFRMTPKAYSELWDAQVGFCMEGLHDLKNPVIVVKNGVVLGFRCRSCHMRIRYAERRAQK